VRVPGGDISRVEVDPHLDDLASGNAEIVSLQVGSFGSRLLCACATSGAKHFGDQHR